MSIFPVFSYIFPDCSIFMDAHLSDPIDRYGCSPYTMTGDIDCVTGVCMVLLFLGTRNNVSGVLDVKELPLAIII